MREILFRGKDILCGDWVEGDLIRNDNRCYPAVFVGCIEASRNRYDDISIDGHYLTQVDPDTVGQYTGLTDKDGKRIFEGDVIDCWSEGVNAKGTVQQRKDGLWIIYPAWQNTIMWGICPDEFCHTTVEVIGNIHDNPELIKED